MFWSKLIYLLFFRFQLNDPENRCLNLRNNWWLNYPPMIRNVPSRFLAWSTILPSTSSRATALKSAPKTPLAVPWTPSVKVKIGTDYIIEFSSNDVTNPGVARKECLDEYLSLSPNLPCFRISFNASTFIHKIKKRSHSFWRKNMNTKFQIFLINFSTQLINSFLYKKSKTKKQLLKPKTSKLLTNVSICFT